MMRRRFALALPALLAACGFEPARRREFPPLAYDYLTPLRLNVAEIGFADPPPPGPLDGSNPAPPAQALLQMAHDGLKPGGSSGRAMFVVDEALIRRVPEGLIGDLAVHLNVLTTDGARAGFAEARASRQSSGTGDLRADLYDITRQMMDDMNVEFEFQVRRTLRDWLQATANAPPPAPVQQQDLGPPPRVAP